MTKTLLLFLAQQTAAPAGQPGTPGLGGSMMNYLPLALILVAMYFFLIAPQRKKQKEHDKMLTTLGAGDEVITSGGVYGVISSVKSDRFVLRISDNNTKIEVGKGFIQTVVKKSGEEKSN